jgi:soluble lytic murein transglycosylase
MTSGHRGGGFRRVRSAVLSGVLAAVVGVAAAGSSAWAGDARVALMGAGVGAQPAADALTALPRVLSTADAELYDEIFAVQERGDWARAERLTERLSDRLLMGHVLAQKFLHPTAYRSQYPELKDWLSEYADHPDAPRLYKLAVKRRPANWKYPDKPTYAVERIAMARRADAGPDIPSRDLSRADRSRARAVIRAVTRALNRGHTLTAKTHLQSKDAERLLSAGEYDRLATRLGHAYFFDGHDDWALKWAGAAAERSGTLVPKAHWVAGLVLWRQGDLKAATAHFEAVERRARHAPWLHSAGAFWAARGALLTGHPERVSGFLGAAAEAPRTFYGLLASRMLGRPFPFDWTVPQLTSADGAALLETPAGRRALALAQIGQVKRAERELKGLLTPDDPESLRLAIGIASLSGMATLAFDLDRRVHGDDARMDVAAYPVPHWRPGGGFRIDPALVYALMRQESHFRPDAKSHRGARGLLQLMPATASFIAKDRRLRGSKRNALFDPETNLDIGQTYIEHLLEEPGIEGDMVRLAAAWNGGPGNVRKWARRPGAEDPLLFMESIPLRETRAFVERVLTNYWIYQHRLGHGTPTLDALAQARAPLYDSDWHDRTQVATGGDGS